MRLEIESLVDTHRTETKPFVRQREFPLMKLRREATLFVLTALSQFIAYLFLLLSLLLPSDHLRSDVSAPSFERAAESAGGGSEKIGRAIFRVGGNCEKRRQFCWAEWRAKTNSSCAAEQSRAG